jgi:glutamate:GABA antiporter
MESKKLTQISTFALVMLISGAIDSLRNLPTTALFGPTLIFFFVVAAVLFLIPTALVSAELSSTYPKSGGVYDWVKKAFGKKLGFLAIWLQWINTIVWYPTILSFIAGLLAYLIDPSLVQHRSFIIGVILVVFWGSTLLNLRGIKASATFAMICGLLGMAIPMALICILGLIWVLSGKHLHIHLSAHSMLPSFSHGNSWIALTAIITSFLGMELATVHVKQIKNAKKIFPKALTYSVILVFVTMILGSLTIAFVLPVNKINLVDGIMQAFSFFFKAYHLDWLTPVISVLILIGSVGSLTNWIISPAKGLLLAAEDNFLPDFLKKVNSKGVPSNLLLIQAVLVSIVCLAFLLMPSVSGAYWLLTDLSTQLYVLMYFIMFLAAIKLLFNKGKARVILLSILGIIGCGLALVVGFIPPADIDVGGAAHFEMMFGIGIVAMLVPVIFGYILSAFRVKK